MAHNEKWGESSIPKPLADPIFNIICQDAETSGLALQSLGNATLLNSGDSPIAKCSASRIRKSRQTRASEATAIDVEALTEGGETILIEAQLSSFTGMSERALLHAQKRLDAKSKTDETLPNAIKKIPRIIALRESEEDFRQIVEAAYRAPHQAEVPRIAIHHLQLPKVPRNRS